MGRGEESEALYDAAEALYRRILPPNDPYMAAVCNNRGLLLRAQGRREEAYASFLKALAVLRECADVEAETAATLLNLASVSPDAATGETHLASAEAYFASPDGQHDIHRFTFLATRAELAFRRGEWAAAGDGFAATAAAWADAGGAAERRKVLLRNALYSYEKAGDAAAAALREEPVERGGVAVGAVPGVVADAGVFVELGERAAGGADGVDHRAGAEGRDDAVGLAVERADRHGDEAGGEVRVAAAADGDGRREEAGAALQQVPDAVAAHRDAGRVDAVGVDGERGEAVVQQLHRERERLGGALRHRVREGAPRRVDPLLPAGALRRHQDERQLPFPPPGEELAAAVHELQAVVRPAFARAVQQEDERDALAVPQVGRDVLPVGERRAGGVREDERLRRGGGLVHRERRAELRPLLRALRGDGLACARGQGRKRSDE